MADVVARWHDAGDMRLVAIKLIAQEASVAYPERVEAKNETGGTTAARVDVHGDRGGAKLVGDGVLVTAVGKMTKQQGIKYHGIETEL